MRVGGWADLREVWSRSPELARPCPLNDYDDDYTGFAPLGAVLTAERLRALARRMASEPDAAAEAAALMEQADAARSEALGVPAAGADGAVAKAG